jgi:hypothetical protein
MCFLANPVSCFCVKRELGMGGGGLALSYVGNGASAGAVQNYIF